MDITKSSVVEGVTFLKRVETFRTKQYSIKNIIADGLSHVKQKPPYVGGFLFYSTNKNSPTN